MSGVGTGFYAIDDSSHTLFTYIKLYLQTEGLLGIHYDSRFQLLLLFVHLTS